MFLRIFSTSPIRHYTVTGNNAEVKMAAQLIPASVKARKLVHICDPDPTTCETLSVVFRLEGYETTFSIDGDQFITTLYRRAPDMALINLEVGEQTGLSLLRRAKTEAAGLQAVMLCDQPHLDAAVAAMKLGATDVLGKPVEHEHILEVVSRALQRDVHIGAMADGRRQVTVRGFAQLTNREREVLQLITGGQTNKSTGDKLGISPRTVEVHRARIMQKLEAKNTADLMRIVLTS